MSDQLKFEKNNKDNDLSVKKISRRTFIGALAALVSAPMLANGKSPNNEKPESVEDKKLIEKVIRIINSYQPGDREAGKKMINDLLNVSENIIGDLNRLTNSDQSTTRYYSYRALAILGNTTLERQKEVRPILLKGETDQEEIIRFPLSSVLSGWGNKESIPKLIEGLDQKYNKISVLSEPIMNVPEYCLANLRRYTQQNFGLDEVKWQNWWIKNKNNLTWEQSGQTFIIKSNE